MAQKPYLKGLWAKARNKKPNASTHLQKFAKFSFITLDKIALI